MTYAVLPLTEDSWQVFALDLAIDGEAFHAQSGIRYLTNVFARVKDELCDAEAGV